MSSAVTVGLFGFLSNRGHGGNGSSSETLTRVASVQVVLLDLAVGVGLVGAVARDVAGLAALVAGLAGSVEGTAVGSSAIAGDVTELAAGVALHGLSLAVAGKVVRATALVAGSGASTASKATTSETAEAATANGSTAGDASGRVGASAHVVTGLAAVVAAAGRTGTADAEGRAVSLDVAETLAVVALLGLGATRKRAFAGLVVGLLAVVAESVGGGAGLGVVAEFTTLVARATREGRHGDG